ncbi:hypothetical protein DIS24_g11595 [Lasiodiplodia hormozganensis]|uniref:Cyanovirin-N domain-containing protein n=1 Tax=Lasiodiplodia hormozganensis TaxID=869390 RepID=A0AA39WNK8_9PEZI|nr:hypothetical protein DIS24_g11595 [Lasiodiplodia hormozganensis]
MSLIRSLCFLSFSLEVFGATCFTSQERLPGDPCGTDIAAALTSEDRVGCFCAGNWDAGDDQQLERSTNHGSVVYSIERTDNTVPLRYCEEAFNNIIDECILDGNTWGGVFSFDGEVYNISNTVYPDNPLLPTDQGGPIGPLKREPQENHDNYHGAHHGKYHHGNYHGNIAGNFHGNFYGDFHVNFNVCVYVNDSVVAIPNWNLDGDLV